MKKVKTGKMLKPAALNRLARLLLFFFVFSVPCSLISVLCPPSAHAEVPVKFTYQGNLRQAGFLVNGNRQMKFRLYTSSDVVDAVWTSSEYTVSVSTGVFRAVLEPELAGLDWENSLWMELEVEGVRLSPREELGSAPYAINSYLLSGKKYTTSLSAPLGPALGDLWMDMNFNILKFFNGTDWTATIGSGVAHATTHAGTGVDPIISLGTHSVTGNLTMISGAALAAGAGSTGIFISTNLIVGGAINPYSNLNMGGQGYSVIFASSVYGGWYYGNGLGLTELNADNISSGYLSGLRIGNVIVSTHIVDGSILGQDIAGNSISTAHIADGAILGQDIAGNSISTAHIADGSILGQDIAANSISTAHISSGSVTRAKLARDGCDTNAILKWNGTEWACSDLSGVIESDPYSVHLQDTLQTGATFYVSSGTANYFTVNNSLAVNGTARISGNVGIGTNNPTAKMEVSGGGNSGEYIVVYRSGNSISAWLRKK